MGRTMSKTALWIFMFIIALAIIGLLVYSDYYGNVEYQKALMDTFKVVIGAVVGAFANEVSK